MDLFRNDINLELSDMVVMSLGGANIARRTLAKNFGIAGNTFPVKLVPFVPHVASSSSPNVYFYGLI